MSGPNRKPPPAVKPKGHTHVSSDPLFGVTYQPRCSCGWSSGYVTNARRAGDIRTEHERREAGLVVNAK